MKLLCNVLIFSVLMVTHVRAGGHLAQEKTQASWDNHGTAFSSMNVDDILLDYTEDSVIIVSDFTTGVNKVFNGLEGVRAYFEALFGYLETNGGFPASLVNPNNGLLVEKDMVFFIWKAELSGITKATNTFFTDHEGKFVVMTVTLWTAAGKPVLTGESADLNADLAADTPQMQHWGNHLDAFTAGDIEKMVQDYNANAHITEYDFSLAAGKEFYSPAAGEAGVRELFPKYFQWIDYCKDKDNNLNFPVIHVAEGFIYLQVNMACASIPKWTETLLIDDNGMIKRHNIVFEVGFEETPPGDDPGNGSRGDDSGPKGLTAGIAVGTIALLAAIATLIYYSKKGSKIRAKGNFQDIAL